MRFMVGAASGVLSAALGSQAWAQAPEPSPDAESAAVIAPAGQSGITSYPASFFAQFRPQQASDMVQNIPGFSFEQGDDDVRGFAGAGGNVLIDGERPTSKSVNLNQVLQRIPVDDVVRIDVIRGGAPGIDMQGQPIMANVIRKGGASQTTTVQLGTKPYPQFNFLGFIPRLEESWRSGPLTLEGFLSGRIDKHVDSGEGGLERRRASGTIFEQGGFDADVDVRSMTGSVAGEYRTHGAAYRLNGSLDRNDQNRREVASLTDLADVAFTERSHTKTRADKAEIGGDYERALNSELTFRVLGLKTFKKNKQNGLLTNRNPSQQSNETSTSGETIARSTLSYVPSARFQFEAGGEGALNYLDARSRLTVGGVPVVLPSANVRVEERRGEGFVTLTSKLGALSLETAARYERSVIEQTGGANQSKTFSFLKPRVFATYSLASSTFRLRFERVVGQLNFRDFAATAQLDAGTVNAGNPDLSPESSWVFEGAVEQRFWGGGAVVLTLRHEEVSDVVDLIPIDGRFDAPGNIGDGTRDELRAQLTLPLERLGLAGAVFRANGTWRRSSVVDPVTGVERRISNQRPFEGDFQFSKTLPRIRSTFYIEASASGGGEGSGNYRETSYRINEIRVQEDGPVIKVILDWAPRPGTALRLQVENAIGKDRIRERTLFQGPRSLNVINFTERRNAHLDPLFLIRLRQRL
jgi:hypothetical protein